MKEPLDLTVLILAQPGEADLAQLVSWIRDTLGAEGSLRYEILVVDGSESKAVRDIGRAGGVRVEPQLAEGYGSAFRQGIHSSSGRYILVVDVDLIGDPALVRRLWDVRGNAGLVIASRYAAGGGATMPLWRRLLSRSLNTVVRRGLSLNTRDVSNAYRLYRCEALAATRLRAMHLDVLEEALIQIHADGWEIREVPFHYTQRRRRSHVHFLGLGWSFARTFVDMWRLRNSVFAADYDERAFNSVIPLQRYWQRTRHKVITGFLTPGTRTLDIGCGSSRIILGLPAAVGVDIQLKKLRRIQPRHSRVVRASLSDLPFMDEAFDTVICSQVIEHVPRERVRFQEMNRLLRPHGTFIVGTPDYATRTWRWLERVYAVVHPRGYVNEHINQYTAESLARDLAEHGFAIRGKAYVGGGELIYKTEKVSPAQSMSGSERTKPSLHVTALGR